MYTMLVTLILSTNLADIFEFLDRIHELMILWITLNCTCSVSTNSVYDITFSCSTFWLFYFLKSVIIWDIVWDSSMYCIIVYTNCCKGFSVTINAFSSKISHLYQSSRCFSIELHAALFYFRPWFHVSRAPSKLRYPDVDFHTCCPSIGYIGLCQKPITRPQSTEAVYARGGYMYTQIHP